MSVTLAQLKENVRNRADLHKDGNVIADSEMTGYINRAFDELYDLMVLSDDARTFTKHAGQLTQIGDFAYTLPPDVYQLVSVHSKAVGFYQMGSAPDPSVYVQLAQQSSYTFKRPEYYYRWNPSTGERTLYLFPDVKDPKNLAVSYIPVPPLLVEDTDTVDNPNSWMEYVEVTAAIKCLAKIERDPSQLMLEKKELTQRIKKAISNLDRSGPKQIRRTTNTDFDFRWNSGL